MRLERGNGEWRISGLAWKTVEDSGFTHEFANPHEDHDMMAQFCVGDDRADIDPIEAAAAEPLEEAGDPR